MYGCMCLLDCSSCLSKLLVYVHVLTSCCVKRVLSLFSSRTVACDHLFAFVLIVNAFLGVQSPSLFSSSAAGAFLSLWCVIVVAVTHDH